MPFVESDIRQALGVGFNPNSGTVMRALLRDAGVQPPLFSVLPRCEDWFVKVANSLSTVLGEFDPLPPAAASDLATELAGALHISLAPVALAILAPTTDAPACSARHLPAECKRQVEAELPAFCDRILARWMSGELPTGAP
jgi:hypothetical protein